MSRIHRPAKAPGTWLDASDPGITEAGCHVCDWFTVGDYDYAREQWLAHEHEPIFDIRHRLKKETDHTYIADVSWLLDRLDQVTETS